MRSTPDFLFDKQNNLSALHACWKALGAFPPGPLRSFGSFLYPLLPAILSECCYHNGGSGLGFTLPAWITGGFNLLPHYSQWNVHSLSPQFIAVSSCAATSSKTPSRASSPWESAWNFLFQEPLLVVKCCLSRLCSLNCGDSFAWLPCAPHYSSL